MKKVICFSLWGDKYRYTGGSLQNVELAKIFYPDWICRFYVGQSTPEKLLSMLESNENVEIVRMNENGDWTGMFWRFQAISDPQVDIMISRDVDSRLSQREKAAVDEWINSNYKFHIIRDHPYHNTVILGGMWGVKKGLIDNISELISDYSKGDFIQVDQNFLREKIYEIVKSDSMVHDEFFERKPFPKESGPRSNQHFVGQAYDGDGKILDIPQYGIVYIQDFLKNENINITTYEDAF